MGKLSILKLFKTLLVLSGLIILLSTLNSCRTIQNSSYDHSNNKEVVIYRDTTVIEFRDSIYEKEIFKNDTVYLYKYKEKILYKDRIVTAIDTIYQEIVKKEKETIIKKEVPKWCYNTIIGLLIAVIGLLFYCKIK